MGEPLRRGRSFTARLTLALALLLLAYGALVAMLGRQVAAGQENEALQRLSHGLAKHIVGHWPEITLADRDQADRAARDALLAMLMVVNPGVQVYVLDADGRVAAYLGEPGMVRQPQVALDPVRDFLAGAPLPLRGTDPMGSGRPRLFSAAMFPPRPGDVRPPGYLYIVLDGAAREQVAGQLGQARVWLGAAAVAAAGLVVTLVLGIFTFGRLTLPLRRLAHRIGGFGAGDESTGSATEPGAAVPADEVQALDLAFGRMENRVQATAERERQQAHAHRETMAALAHDLRTPLTALHGQLEALAGNATPQPGARAQMLGAALAQSDKVRKLSQQLFELAALQASDQVMQCERFSLDELVTDAVQKFGLIDASAPVVLDGSPPGRLELNGDLQLIERAITNLIDNALRHAPGALPVRVSLRRDGAQAQIVVEDTGPGLPADLLQRLHAGQSLRDPPLVRTGGGIGGLGLAIAQRVATLHGGSLRPLPATRGGTRLCLALPLAS